MSKIGGTVFGRLFKRSVGDEEKVRAMGFQRIRIHVQQEIDAYNREIAEQQAEPRLEHPAVAPEPLPFVSLLDLYFDNGTLYALLQEQGHLMRAQVFIAPDEAVTLSPYEPVTEAFIPIAINIGEAVVTPEVIEEAVEEVDATVEAVEEIAEAVVEGETVRQRVLRVFQQPDGRYRWLSISSTAFLNRVGEIDSRALFDSFVAHAEATGEYPYRTFMHHGEALRTGKADFLARSGLVYITSGLYDADSPLAAIEIAALSNARTAAKWGESIGYQPTVEPEMTDIGAGIVIPVYRAGIHREISTCPEGAAAAWFTSSQVTEVKRMDGMVRNALFALMKDAGVDETEQGQLIGEFERVVDRVNQHGDDPAVIARSTVAATSEVADVTDADSAASSDAVEEPAADDAPAAELVIDDSVLDALDERLGLSDRLEAMSAQIGQLSEVVTGINGNLARMQQVADRVPVIEEALRVQREVIEEAPAPSAETARRVVYRPMARTTDNGQGEVVSYDDIAAATLSRMPNR